MSKMFDNSGKNTQNEIYDTSHRQYWAPPGFAPFKDNLIGFLGIILSIILVALIDCFLLHPIPAPEGTFDPQRSDVASFVLADSGCEYADAKILSSDTSHRGSEVYLVEKDGETHLLLFHESVLFTRKIAGDVLISNPQAMTRKVGNWPFHVFVTIEGDREITNVDTFGSLIHNQRNITLVVYILAGIAIALTGSFIWQKIKKIIK